MLLCTYADYHSAFKTFIQSVQPIVGKLTTTELTKTEEATIASKGELEELEELQSLRDMISDTREQLLHSHETLAKIRREKNELLMKLSKAQGELCEKEQTIAELQDKVKDAAKICNCLAQPKTLNLLSSGVLTPSPPPPPPPPPPSPPPMTPSISSSQSMTHHQPISRSHSKYHHPVDVNLYFSSLQSLVETSQSMLTSSNKKAYRASMQKRGSRSLTETPKDEACSMPRATTKVDIFDRSSSRPTIVLTGFCISNSFGQS